MVINVLEFLKEYVEIFVGLITIAFTFFGISTSYTFITANSFERQFFSKESKILYSLVTHSLFLIILPTFIAFANFYNNEKLFIFINKYIYIVLIFYFAILGLLIIMKIVSLSKIKNYLIKNNLKFIISLNKRKFRNIIVILLFISTWAIIGTTNYYVLTANNIENAVIGFILFYFIELYIVFISVSLLVKINLTEPILVTIKMDNGDIFENFFIYNTSKHNFLQIGKEKDPILCNEPLLIPISKIASCKRVSFS